MQREAVGSWRTSSYTRGNECVEVGWRKSAHSPDVGMCVEVSNTRAVRDSKDPDGPQLRLSLSAFRTMINGIKEMEWQCASR